MGSSPGPDKRGSGWLQQAAASQQLCCLSIHQLLPELLRQSTHPHPPMRWSLAVLGFKAAILRGTSHGVPDHQQPAVSDHFLLMQSSDRPWSWGAAESRVTNHTSCLSSSELTWLNKSAGQDYPTRLRSVNMNRSN